jgi:hypothetical protein
MELVGVAREYQETAEARRLRVPAFQVWVDGKLTDPQLVLGNRVRLPG